MKVFEKAYNDILNKNIFIEQSDESTKPENGWGDDVKSILQEILQRSDSLAYEINNCAKGSFTKCKETSDLAEYLKSVANSFQNAAEQIEKIKE